MQTAPAVATRYCIFTLDEKAVKLETLRPPVQFQGIYLARQKQRISALETNLSETRQVYSEHSF